jgi:hypothetical protein
MLMTFAEENQQKEKQNINNQTTTNPSVTSI